MAILMFAYRDEGKKTKQNMGDREFLKKTPSIVRQLSLRVMFFVIHCPLKSVSSCSRWRLLILMFWGWATLNGHWYWILGLKKADIKTKRFAISTPGVFTVKWDGHSYPLQERRGTAVETDSCEYCTDWNDWKYAKKYYCTALDDHDTYGTY